MVLLSELRHVQVCSRSESAAPQYAESPTAAGLCVLVVRCHTRFRPATPLTCSRLALQALTGQAAFSNRDAPNGQQQQAQQQQQHHQLGAGGSTGGGGSRAVDQLLYGPTSGSRAGGSSAIHPVATPAAATSDPRPAAMFGLAPSGGFLSTGTPSAGSFSRTSYHSAGGQPPSPHDAGGGSSFHRTSLHAQSPSPHSQTASPMAGGTPAMIHPAASLPQSHWATQAAAAAAASRPPSAAAPSQAPSQAPRAGAPGLGTLATEPAAATAVKLQQHPAMSGPAAAEQGVAARGATGQHRTASRGAEAGASVPPQGQAGAKRGQHVRSQMLTAHPYNV